MPELPPRGAQSWLDHAARVKAAYGRQQIHSRPDFLYRLCVFCGTEKEYHPHDVHTFRFDCATHDCSELVVQDPPGPLPALVPEPSPQSCLF